MIKKISKKILLAVSVIVSSFLGFLLPGPDKDTTPDATLGLLQQPILAINTAHGDAGCGDCSGTNTDGGWDDTYTPPSPTSAAVYVGFERF